MNIEIKAALLSGFVFPGLGQLYLKRYLRGLFIMMLVLLGLIIIVGIATVGALESLNAIQIQGGTVDMNTISNLVTTHSTQTGICFRVIFLFIACCWIFSVIDAYKIGKRKI
ncbi:MAG: hypothetical protein V2A69_12685 [Pseudomonadota bacterium]